MLYIASFNFVEFNWVFFFLYFNIKSYPTEQNIVTVTYVWLPCSRRRFNRVILLCRIKRNWNKSHLLESPSIFSRKVNEWMDWIRKENREKEQTYRFHFIPAHFLRKSQMSMTYWLTDFFLQGWNEGEMGFRI